MKSKANAYEALDDYPYTIGIPNPVKTNNAGEEYGEEWKHIIKKYLIQQ
jgi:hypothetical protein